MGWLSHRGSISRRVPLADVLTLPLAVYVILLPNGRLTVVIDVAAAAAVNPVAPPTCVAV